MDSDQAPQGAPNLQWSGDDAPPAVPEAGSGTAPPAVQWSPAQPVTGPAPGLAYAGFLMRFFAYLIDSLVIGLLYFVLLIVVGGGLAAAGSFSGAGGGGTGLIVIIAVVTLASFAYFAWSWVNWGATPGQRLLNLKVVRAEDGQRLDYGRATVRWAVLTLPVISLVLFFITWIWPLIVAVWVAASARKQGPHDLAARSFVVQYLPGTR
jgi:uncharacterized RDD family membrane protein YckC